MNRVTIETPYGTTLEYQHFDGVCFSCRRVQRIPSRDMKVHVETMKTLEIRTDDVYLATFEKSGTHWVWEILMMLRKGNTEYERIPKEYAFLDHRSKEHISEIPSPRILNSHSPVKHTPTEIFTKRTKIIHVMRNPKDIFVSLYHHMKTLWGTECETFSRFLPLVMGTYGIYQTYPWFKYVKEWVRFTKDNPDQILNIYYEDLKEDPVREIKKMNAFLQCGRSDDLIEQIAMACSFNELKEANITHKDYGTVGEKGFSGDMMYRKGNVGDWKNWFTVADNEKMDAWLKEHLDDTDLKFRYQL